MTIEIGIPAGGRKRMAEGLCNLLACVPHGPRSAAARFRDHASGKSMLQQATSFHHRPKSWP